MIDLGSKGDNWVGLVDGNNFYVSCERIFDRKLVGKPVAVLSNNDGCCVAMSPEFKALGIARGTPYFQLRDREREDGLFFRSSNYELYGDISNRIISILREETLEVDQYSIDEAFIYPPIPETKDFHEIDKWLNAYGSRLRSKILRWVGIPCGIGFAKTKTLAKIANHIGKKKTSGIFVMPEDPSEILAATAVEEVWGVGRRLPLKLKAERIFTAKALCEANDEVLRRIGGVTLLRMAMELRGEKCNQDREYESSPDSVSCSRSFGQPVTTKEAIRESVSSFVAQAATKLRKHEMLASSCCVYAQLSTGEDVARTVVFEEPTDATSRMLSEIKDSVDKLYLPGAKYRKAGVVFFGLEKVGSVRQGSLFEPFVKSEASELYKTIDELNSKLGKGSVISAAEGIGSKKRSWAMKREKLSKRATTSWHELMTVR